jgi:hypothetical protein
MLFQETQYLRYSPLYVWLIVCWAGTLGLLLISDANWLHYLFISAVFASIILLLYSSKLSIKIVAENITLSMFPFFGNEVFSFSEIATISVHEINPLMDYGGWGYRIVPFQNTTAYIMQGNKGATLVLKKSDQKIVISLKNAEAFERALAQTTYGSEKL